jgi:phospholipase D1/2
MIIDDETIICGSANINDRSMVGDRDSELAVITRGEDFIEGKMNDQSVLVSQIAQELRIKLWKEHFALSEEELIDPLSKSLWEVITERAARNTDIYRRIFACYPDDTMKNRK